MKAPLKLGRAESPDAFREAPLLDHLEELRLRIIYAILAWLGGTSVAYFFRAEILAALNGPLDAFRAAGNNVRVVSLDVTEPLMTVFYVSLFGGLVVALPFMVYQVWAFVAPGLTRQERVWGGPFIVGLGVSFGLGVAFAYYVILPAAVPFLLSVLPGIENLLSVGKYITQMVTYMGVFGLLFELPITLFLLTKVGLVNAGMLARGRRIAVMVIVIASAIITPTADPFNLALMAGPLYVLYEIGIIFSMIAGRQNRRAAALTDRLTDGFDD